jgi:hypothetical protein
MNYSNSRHKIAWDRSDVKYAALVNQKKVRRPVIKSAWFYKQPIR